ncbi:MAG: hypothetical protein JRI68_02560 [Deltaproteobacteria bacterium]|nr:hypothetical protein [Deltaproteobacteria bacterium]
MRWTYSCPSCEAMLNPDETIILVAAREDSRHLICFHPEPGNYEIHIPPGAQMEEGTKWDFLCPVCHGDLAIEKGEDLCVVYLQEGETQSKVLFSRVAGEQMTFVTGVDEA